MNSATIHPHAGDLAACLRQMGRMVAMRSALMENEHGGVPYVQPLMAALGLFERLGIGYAFVRPSPCNWLSPPTRSPDSA